MIAKKQSDYRIEGEWQTLEPGKIEVIRRDMELKTYVCPHCWKMLMKGNVKRLKMTCPHCQKMVDEQERDLLELKT